MEISNIHKIYMATSLLKEMDGMKNTNMIGILSYNEVPEAYKFIEDIIIFNYRLSIYKNGTTQIVSIRDVGIFQII